MKWQAIAVVALVALAVIGADARSHLKAKHKARSRSKAKYMTQSDYVAIANGQQGNEVPAAVLKQFATPPAPLRQAPNPYVLGAQEHTFMNALGSAQNSFRFAQEEPAANDAAANDAAANDGAAAGGNILEGVSSREEAEEKCAQAAAVGAEDATGATSGATPAAQNGDASPGGAGVATGESNPLPGDQPAIQMPDGRRLPLPPGCDPTAPGAAASAMAQEIFPESMRIPPGEGPCQACDNGPPPEPIKEIQILEWQPGHNQPLVLGKQLLTNNKTKLMLKVFDGQFDKEMAEERKEQEQYNEEVNKANDEMKNEAVEYAGALLKSQELSQNQLVENALAEALGVWGLEQSYGKETGDGEGNDPAAAANAVEEEQLAAETVADAESAL